MSDLIEKVARAIAATSGSMSDYTEEAIAAITIVLRDQLEWYETFPETNGFDFGVRRFARENGIEI
jgi:hypothetical protein